MYCPYLRGKQYELLALRDFSQDNQNNEKIVPIIEPVKQQLNGLNTAITLMRTNGLKFAVVLNPKDGDFKHPNINNDILTGLTPLADDREHWIPAYVYKGYSQRLLNHAEVNGLDSLMVIFPDGVDVGDENVMEFVSNEKIAYVVIGNLGNNRSARGRLLRLGKEIISLEDRFRPKAKNADYADSVDEQFSEDFAYYQDDRLSGFADYTPLAKDFIEGGMLPYAIAIHLTYQKSDDQLYVHHFVSDSNFDQSNIRGKFHEAAAKIAPFYDGGGYFKTPSVEELIEKASSEDGYPGLGYIKKLSIKNHLELINHILPE